MTNKESTKLDKIETTLNKLVGSLVGVNASDGFINRTNKKFTKLFDVIEDVKISMVSRTECKDFRNSAGVSGRWIITSVIAFVAICVATYAVLGK